MSLRDNTQVQHDRGAGDSSANQKSSESLMSSLLPKPGEGIGTLKAVSIAFGGKDTPDKELPPVEPPKASLKSDTSFNAAVAMNTKDTGAMNPNIANQAMENTLKNV